MLRLQTVADFNPPPPFALKRGIGDFFFCCFFRTLNFWVIIPFLFIDFFLSLVVNYNLGSSVKLTEDSS